MLIAAWPYFAAIYCVRVAAVFRAVAYFQPNPVVPVYVGESGCRSCGEAHSGSMMGVHVCCMLCSKLLFSQHIHTVPDRKVD